MAEQRNQCHLSQLLGDRATPSLLLTAVSPPQDPSTPPNREVEVEVQAGFIWGDGGVSTELMASSWEQPSAPRPMAIQLQGVAEVGKQATWAGRKARDEGWEILPIAGFVGSTSGSTAEPTLKLRREGADPEACLELDSVLLLLTG